MSARAPYEPPIRFERLRAMIAALESPWPLRGKLRREIVDALDWMFVTFSLEAESTPGRHKSTAMWWYACRVHCLVKHHGAYLHSAVLAVLGDNADHQHVDALKKSYRSIVRTTNFSELLSIAPDIRARDVARLPVTRRRK